MKKDCNSQPLQQAIIAAIQRAIREYFLYVHQRPTSYTWEQNTQIQDENLTYYKNLHSVYKQLQADVKEARADLKRTGDKLANAHPDSESIKHGFTVAIMA